MNQQECPRRARQCVVLVVLLALAALSAACSDPEQAKAEHLRRGEELLQQQKYQEATLEFRNAVQIDEKLAAAHWGLARAYEGLRRVGEALDELRKTVELDPNHVLARLKLANAYILAYNQSNPKNQDYLAQAERYSAEILEREPQNIDGHILAGNILQVRGKTPEALQKIQYAISLDPKRLESHLGLARFYWQTGDHAKADETFRHAISLNDRASLSYVEYGRYLAQTERTGEAEAQFRKAAEVDPQNRDVRFLLASFYLGNRRLDKAEEAYRDYAQLDWDKPEGRVRLADFYASVDRYQDAANIYQEVVKTFPDYTRGRYRLGEIMLQTGDRAGAAAQADELLRRNERDADALFLRARVRLEKNHPQETKDAIADLKTILAQEPRSQLALYYLAEALFKDGQAEPARAALGDLERFHPDFLPAKLMQAQLNLYTGDPDAARRLATEFIERLSKSEPGNLTPQMTSFLRARALTTRGTASLSMRQRAKTPAEQASELGRARADFEAAREAMPNSPSSHTNLGGLARVESKRDEALQHYERALALDRASFDALGGLIGLYAEMNRPQDARARVEQALSAQPDSAPLLFLKAQAYALGNQEVPSDPQAVEQSLRRAVEVDPDYVEAYKALAQLYFGQRQPDRALEEYRKIVARRPTDAEAYTHIGMIEHERKNLDAAVESYRRALQLNPDAVNAANNLAMLYADAGKGNLDEAVRLVQQIVRNNPNDPGYADTLGWVYYRKGLHAAAVEQLQRAVQLAPALKRDKSIYHYHLGMALAAKGDKAAARRELQTAIRMYEEESPERRPATPVADEARRTLDSL